MPKMRDMSLKQFSENHRLKLRRDEYLDYFVGGKRGQIYEHAPDRLAILFLGNTKRQWHAAKKKLAAAGFELLQDADTEGTASFDLADAEQCQVAIRVVKAKTRRVMSPAGLAHLHAAREKAARNRQNHCNRGVSGVDPEPLDPQTTPRSSQEI